MLYRKFKAVIVRFRFLLLRILRTSQASAIAPNSESVSFDTVELAAPAAFFTAERRYALFMASLESV